VVGTFWAEKRVNKYFWYDPTRWIYNQWNMRTWCVWRLMHGTLFMFSKNYRALLYNKVTTSPGTIGFCTSLQMIPANIFCRNSWYVHTACTPSLCDSISLILWVRRSVRSCDTCLRFSYLIYVRRGEGKKTIGLIQILSYGSLICAVTDLLKHVSTEAHAIVHFRDAGHSMVCGKDTEKIIFSDKFFGLGE